MQLLIRSKKQTKETNVLLGLSAGKNMHPDSFKMILSQFIVDVCDMVFKVKVAHRSTLLFMPPGLNMYSKTLFCGDKH